MALRKRNSIWKFGSNISYPKNSSSKRGREPTITGDKSRGSREMEKRNGDFIIHSDSRFLIISHKILMHSYDNPGISDESPSGDAHQCIFELTHG